MDQIISVKQKILKNFILAPSMSPREKNHPVYQSARNLNSSILFRGVTLPRVDREYKIETTDLEKLPYTDLMILIDSDIYMVDDDPLAKSGDVLIRIWRWHGVLHATLFYRSAATAPTQYRFTMMSIFKFNSEKRKFVDSRVLRHDGSGGPLYIESLAFTYSPVIVDAIRALVEYEPIITNDPTTTRAVKNKVPAIDLPKYIEYTLDLSKPRRVSKGNGGTHASPMEHTRRGHWRTSKTGKRFFVRDTVVNKGSKRGKVVKDYTM